MAITEEALAQLGRRFAVLLPHLNERQRRLAVAAEARLLGHGGVRAAAQVVGMSETTVRRGVAELEAGEDPLPDGRVRAPGGGRKRAEQTDPAVLAALLALVEPDERGDPESPLRWTTKSLRHLAEELTRQGHPVSAPTAGRLLKSAGFSLQANAKTLEGTQHPDRDAQFRYINEQVKDHQAGREPVISVEPRRCPLRAIGRSAGHHLGTDLRRGRPRALIREHHRGRPTNAASAPVRSFGRIPAWACWTEHIRDDERAPPQRHGPTSPAHSCSRRHPSHTRTPSRSSTAAPRPARNSSTPISPRSRR